MAGRVNHYQQKKWAREEREEYERQYGAQPAPTMAPSPASGAVDDGEDDVIDQLKELSSLHEAGVLTDDEFVAAKSRVLASG